MFVGLREDTRSNTLSMEMANADTLHPSLSIPDRHGMVLPSPNPCHRAHLCRNSSYTIVMTRIKTWQYSPHEIRTRTSIQLLNQGIKDRRAETSVDLSQKQSPAMSSELDTVPQPLDSEHNNRREPFLPWRCCCVFAWLSQRPWRYYPECRHTPSFVAKVFL